MGELHFEFQSQKSAQAAAFILKRAGGEHTKGHLVKMLYGADRRQMRRTGIPITGDDPYSMQCGPILSNILDILDGDKTDAFWKDHISTASSDTHKVKLLAEMPDDLLSENEKEALAFSCDFFRNMSWKDVKKFCHDPKNFAEWKDPGTSRNPISHETILKNVGKSTEFIDDLKALRQEEQLIERLLAG